MIECDGIANAVGVGMTNSCVTGRGRDPSRTTVDLGGSCWATNRAEGSFSSKFNEVRGSAIRIGITLGGVRHRKNPDNSFTADPSGQYIRNWSYTTCQDKDGDGAIRTSTGLGDILPWPNTNNSDSDGGVSTAEDECIINYMRVAGIGARTVAVDKLNRVYIGGYDNQQHELYDPTLPEGTAVPGTRVNLGCGGYGGLIDRNGILWSALPNSQGLRVDTNVNPVSAQCHPWMNGYGIAVDPNTGHIWQSSLGDSNAVMEFNNSVVALPLHSYPQPFEYGAQGLVVDIRGHVFVA